MTKTPPTVRCVFASDGKMLPELLEECFQLYLRRILTQAGEAVLQP